MPTPEFDFIDDDSGGRFVQLGGPIVELRQLLARGEVDAAVKIYEETGGLAKESLLTEASTASFDSKRSIAQLFRKARDFGAAARLFQITRLDNDAAGCFEQAGEFGEAAAAWLRAGEVVKAGAAFERAGNVDKALDLYREAGAKERIAECLARAGRFVEAAKEFRALKKPHAEVETLQTGLTAEPDNVELTSRFAELMLQHGKKDQAAALLTGMVKRVAAARDDPRFLTLLAAALDGVGQADGAAKVRARLKALAPSGAAAPVVDVAPSAEAGPAPGTDAYGFLKALPMFADLSLPDMKSLYRLCSLVTFEAGQHLIEPGRPGRGLFVIVGGQVEVFAGADANARLLNTMGVGAYVGEISLVQDGPTSARVTARAPVRALFISRDAFLQYVYANPAAGLRIYQLFTYGLAERVRALSAAK